MKRIFCLLLVILLLAGCKPVYPDDYVYVESNQAPYAYRETNVSNTSGHTEAEQINKTVSNIADIRKGIQSLMESGISTGRFLVTGSLAETDDLPEKARDYLITYSPKCVFAANRLDLTEEHTDQGLVLDVNIEAAMSPEEFSGIKTCRNVDASTYIVDALKARLTTYTIEIIKYADTDFDRLIEEYVLKNPNETIEVPRISVEMFPEKPGYVNVLRFEFQYTEDTETLQWQQMTVNSLLETYQTQFREEDDAQRLLDTLYSILVPASGYKEDPDATDYTLFVKKAGNSRMMASVAAYFCKKSNHTCGVIIGEREKVLDEIDRVKSMWIPWYWNWIRDGDQILFFDLHSAALREVDPVVISEEELTGYRFDPDKNPDLAQAKAELPQEPEETEPTEEPTEDVTEEPTEGTTEETTPEPSVTPTETP